MNDQSVGLTDPEFWENPEKADDHADVLNQNDFSGVQLAAPTAVPIDLRSTLPAILFRAGSFRDVWSVGLRKHGILTGVNLDTNDVYVTFAADQEAIEPVRDPASAPDGYTVKISRPDLRKTFGIPWKPACFLFTAVLREKLSNRAKVSLIRSPQSFEDPEVARMLEAARAKPQPRTISPVPGDPLPSYRKRDDSPPIPEKPGIALASDRVIVLKPNESKVVLRASYRLPVLPVEVVKPPDEPPAPDSPPPPTALLGITLLVTGSERPGPFAVKLNVPTYDPIPPDPTGTVTGHFAVDLLTLGVMGPFVQTVFVYAFSGEILEGPFPIGLITETMLKE